MQKIGKLYVNIVAFEGKREHMFLLRLKDKGGTLYNKNIFKGVSKRAYHLIFFLIHLPIEF